MTRLALCAFAVALVGAAVSGSAAIGADEKNDVTGTWNFEVAIGGVQGMPVFTFKQDGEKLTGKYKGQFGSADVAGEVKGKDIKFTFEIEGGAGKIVYTGTIDKDTMKGDTNYADQASGTWTAKRAPKKDS